MCKDFGVTRCRCLSTTALQTPEKRGTKASRNEYAGPSCKARSRRQSTNTKRLKKGAAGFSGPVSREGVSHVRFLPVFASKPRHGPVIEPLRAVLKALPGPWMEKAEHHIGTSP